jgi:putative ABC transport system permease protein
MLKNYLTIALRNISRHKGYTFLNVSGLAVGIASCILIFFFIRNELSYDTYHQDADRLYRVAIDIQSKADNRVFAQTGAPLVSALKKDFPQVEQAVQLWRWNSLLVKYGEEKSFYEDNFFLTTPEIFQVFTIPLIKGDPRTALSRPNTVVMAEETARKYFGNEEAVGKTITVNKNEYEVTGVIAKLPHNSHLKLNMLTSLATLEKEEWVQDVMTNWHSTMFLTYIKAKPSIDMAQFNKQIATTANAYVGDLIKEWGVNYAYFLQPVKDIHLHSNLSGEAEVPGSAINVYILSVVAILILLIACLNYINLTTAQAANRAKEVGVRKVVGASRTPLIFQFIAESLLLTIAALLLAIGVVYIVHPLFEQLSGQTIAFSQVITPLFITSLIAATLLLGVLSAAYPALFLSSFRPVSVLKGKLSMGAKGSTLRQVLVVCQFTISLMLIVGTMMVYRQLNFMKNENLGFAKEQVVVLPLRGGASIKDNYEQIKNEFTSHAPIAEATASASVPGRGVDNFSISLLGETDDRGQSMYYLFVDFDFLKLYNIAVVAGRAFNKNLASDAETAFMINEKAVRAFGWASAEEAIGKKLSTGFGRDGEIIGVYKDFHYRSLQAPVEPLVMAVNAERFKHISLKVQTNEVAATMAFVENKWKELFPNHPFEYFFLDEEFNKQYAADEKIGRTFLVFTSIAICVACLGLFGLATFTAQQRTKEIGVRKVLGASVPNIVLLLSKDFTKLVFIAFLIATPLSYVLIGKWLENFASRINIGWEAFIVAGIGVLLIALLTVSYQSIKAALMNPVKSLRNE